MYQSIFPDKKVSKRTGKTTLACVGFAKSTRALAPWDDEDTIIMGLNEAYVDTFMERWDIWMQIHASSNFSRPDNENDPNHYEWLTKAKGFPILMQSKYPDIPASVKYPLQEAKRLIPGTLFTHTGGRYFTSSVAYQLAWGMLEGFDRIEFYGFEMASDTEYFRQRACFEFWLGLATGMGIEIYLPKQCGILRDSLYGYEKMSVGFEQRLEIMDRQIEQQKHLAVASFHQLKGRRDQLYDVSQEKKFDIKKELKRLDEEVNKQHTIVQQITGAGVQQKEVLKFYRSYPFEEDMGDEVQDDE